MVCSSNSALPGSRISHRAVKSGSGKPQLRTLFLIRITLFKYRLQLPGFELRSA